jgi:hypothetical protein
MACVLEDSSIQELFIFCALLSMWADMLCEKTKLGFYLYVYYEPECLNLPFCTINIETIEVPFGLSRNIR